MEISGAFKEKVSEKGPKMSENTENQKVKKKLKIETNEVGCRFQELSIGQKIPLDCGYSLGMVLAKEFKKTIGKLRFFLFWPLAWPRRDAKRKQFYQLVFLWFSVFAS